jgi:replicative DNA helicase
MRWESYNFTDDFQDCILACLIKFPKEFYAFGEIIQPQYFNGPAASELVFRLIEYRKKFGDYPTFTTLGNFAFHKAARVNIDHAKETLEYVEKLAQIDTKDKAAILSLCIAFAQERAIYDANRKIHAAQTEGKPINPRQIMEEAMAVGTNMDDLGLSLCYDVEKILRQINNVSYGIKTGYQEFDKLWKNGWGPGWLVVPLAPPKRYKTAFSLNLALQIATQQDVDVIYYACELTQELAAMRIYTNLTGWTQEQFQENLERGILITKKAVKKLWGNVWIKGYPSKSTSISELKAHARQVIGTCGLQPRAIIIDYAETVRPDTVDKKAPDWRQQSDIYTQARAFGAELGCTMIMPDRCNGETVGKKVPNMRSFQGSFEKAGIVDIAIGLCATDAEYKHDRIRYFVFLNRHGEAYKHYEGVVDPAHMRVVVNGEIEYKPEEEDGEKKPRGYLKRKMAGGSKMTQND